MPNLCASSLSRADQRPRLVAARIMWPAQRRGIAINLAFLAPLTPFRHFVMGPDALERAASAEETMKIKELLREAVAAGAGRRGGKDYLLSPMRKADLAVLDEVLDRAATAVRRILEVGPAAAMNEFNRRELDKDEGKND